MHDPLPPRQAVLGLIFGTTVVLVMGGVGFLDACYASAIFWLSAWLIYAIYLRHYFRSQKFLALKRALKSHIDDCNALNEHIAELREAYAGRESQPQGRAKLTDHSVFNFSRKEWSKAAAARWVHNCSASVVKNAHNQPFKYVCKYFNVPVNEASLAHLEHALNSFAAAEQGKTLLMAERQEVLASIRNQVPPWIRAFHEARLAAELGFEPVDLSDLYFPVYSFQYVSPAGNSAFSCDVKLDVANLEAFAAYLAALIQFRNSIAGQRALMTASLREKIKRRDRYTCQHCGLSTAQEKNLLLEIDHKVPLARGGITAEDNLQTLCWRCNRSKGAKLIAA